VALTSGLTVADVQSWPDVLAAVTPEDVIAAAEALFEDPATVTGYLMQPTETAADPQEVSQ
jgi:zinc protease